MPQSGKTRRILVTGGAGYIGSLLVGRLLERGYDVTVLDSFLYDPTSLTRFRDKIRVIRGDVRNTASIKFAMQGVNTVIHLAEIVGDPACAVDPSRTREVNFRGTQTVANIAKELGVRRFVYTSSCSVYGLTSGDRLYREDDPLNPQSLYAELKVRSEEYLSSLADETFLPTILRLSTVHGASHRPRFDLFVNTIVARAIVNGQMVIQGADSWRPFVHAADVGRIIVAMLERRATIGFEIFNAGHASQNYTLMDVAHMVQRMIPTASLKVLDQAPSDRRSYRVDFSKLDAAISFSPQYTVERGIEELLTFVSTDTKYDQAMYSNFGSAKKLFDQIDPKRAVTMRTQPTMDRYRTDTEKRQKTVGACALCAIPECEDFPELQHWRVVLNQYPYDKIAETSWILMPRRCLSKWDDLTDEERQEYRDFRLIAGDYGVNFFMWSTPATQSVPMHYHEHLLRLHREK